MGLGEEGVWGGGAQVRLLRHEGNGGPTLGVPERTISSGTSAVRVGAISRSSGVLKTRNALQTLRGGRIASRGGCHLGVVKSRGGVLSN